jgi:hypothetical protein
MLLDYADFLGFERNGKNRFIFDEKQVYESNAV